MIQLLSFPWRHGTLEEHVYAHLMEIRTEGPSSCGKWEKVEGLQRTVESGKSEWGWCKNRLQRRW